MSNAKNIGVIVVALSIAFLLGYKRDLLSSAVKTSQESNAGADKELKVQENQEKNKPETIAPSASMKKNIVPPKIGPIKAKAKPSKNQKTTPHNPYAAMMKAASEARKRKGENLSGTIDSIRAGEIGESRKVQRNAYFDKLSQQLKELRGETPPPSSKTKAPSQAPSANIPKEQAAPPQEVITPKGDQDDSLNGLEEDSEFSADALDEVQEEIIDALNNSELDPLDQEIDLDDDALLVEPDFNEAELLQ